MHSKILEKILVQKTNKEENSELQEIIINLIVLSDKFHIFEEVMSDVKENFFVRDNIHGISHNERVVVHAMALGIRENLSEEELKIVLTAALYHDIGRTQGKGSNHGILSAQILENNKNEILPDVDEFDLDLIKFLCVMHSNPDDEFLNIAKEFELSDSASLRKMVNILKDADALDRVRLPRFGKINVDYLRTDYAKQMVNNAKSLFREYLDIQYELGITFDTSVFDIEKLNIIQDEENYYIFRTLNDDNIKDLNDSELGMIRTKGQVARDRGETTKYTEESQISLEEVYTNVRVAKSGKENNCISFSSNANVNLDYDNQQYIMYAIPKTGDNSSYLAGKYMLEEINKKISQKLRTAKIDDEIRDIISQIDSETSREGIKALVGDSLEKLHPRQESMRFTGKKNELVSKESMVARFDEKQFLTKAQELEYNKVIAKLTVLEVTGILRSILPTQANNTTLLATIGGAFSSSEFIHYGQIDKKQITTISKSNMELFAILQQAENIEGIDKEKLRDLKTRVLANVKMNNELEGIDKETAYRHIDSTPERIISLLTVDDKEKNIIPYYKGNIALEYIKNYADAKMRTYQLIEGLRKDISSTKEEELLKVIENVVIAPNKKIISRKNNSGVQIAESVNLDMNPDNDSNLFSQQEQRDLIEAINKLSREEIQRISQGDYTVIEEKKILAQNIVPKSYLENPNAYFVDYIIDSVNLEQIYKVSNVRTEKKKELRQKLADKLNQVDINKLYSAFTNAGIDYKSAPNYIVNLLLEDGYDKTTFEELLNTENLSEFIAENINNFNSRITPYSLDRFLGILDNNYKVQDSSIVLRDYQEVASKGIDRIFETKNFAGVVLPTGAGKSFVAMTEMLKFQKQSMVYFAPQEEILRQVQKHILKNIVGKTIITIEDIDSMIEMTDEQRREFLLGKVYNQDTNIAEELKNIKKASTEEEKKAIKNKILPRDTAKYNDIMDAIHTVFPHLEMHCYQSLNSSKYEELLNKKIDFMIFDELHRTGAETWRPLIKELIKTHPNSKSLGITATPVRDDNDHTDMMKYMAENYGGYTKEEIDNKDYLAQEMYLIDAMQNKYVVEPKIVSFNFSLKDTEQYKYVTETLKAERSKNPNSELVKDLQQIKDSMDEIINGGKGAIKNNLAGISGVLEENIPENLRNGRFIVFLEQRPKSSNMTTEQYVQQQIKEVNKCFSGVNKDVNAGYLLSNRQDKSGNAEAIQDFETLSNEQLKLLYAINMLNEGVHVDNINGELMLRQIGSGSNILYFQQIGRVIYGIDPNNPPSEDSVPIIFDVYNNYLTRDLDRMANMTTPTSDLNNIQMIYNWVNRHERIPDINSEKKDEARMAINLKKIQQKYEKYLEGINNSNLSVTEKREIEKIIEIAKELNLFDLIIPDRIIPPGEEELGRVRAFEVKGDTKKFLDLFKQSKKVIKQAKKEVKQSDTLRIRNTMSILQILGEYGIDLSDETFTKLYQSLTKEKDYDTAKDNAKNNLTLLSLIDANLSDGTRDRVIRDLDMDIDELKEYQIYGEFDFARKAFGSNKKSLRKIFSIYDIKDIRKSGILKEDGKNILAVNERGFVNQMGPEIFNGINIYTGTSYDEEGYNIRGFDVEGYDRNGYDIYNIDRLGFRKGSDENIYHFTRDGLNLNTNSNVDENGYDIEGFYWAPNPEFPDDYTKRINTHKKINKYGFSRDEKLYRQDENGNLIFVGFEDEYGFKAFEDVNKYDFRRDGINIKTGTKYNEYGFDIRGIHKDTNEKYNRYGFTIDKIHIKTNMKLSPEKFDIDQFFYQIGDYSQEINTFSYYNEEGRDIDGWDINGIDKEGVCHFTQPPDERGFNEKKINLITKRIFDENGLDYYGRYCEIHGNKLIVTESKHGKNGLTKDGVDKRGFRRDKFNIITNSWVDENNWDADDYYWAENEDGELVNTGSKFAPDGYSRLGFDKHEFNRNHKAIIKRRDSYGRVTRIESSINRYGFTYELIHQNGTPYDDNGFDADGIHQTTQTVVNKYGFNRDLEFCIQNENGEWISTGEKWNKDGFDIKGLYHYLWSNGTRLEEGSGEFDQEGYDIDGRNKDGFNREHLYVDSNGVKSKVNPNGFGYDGFIYEYDKKTGEYIKTDRIYDDEGYDFGGLNVDKFDRNHLYMHENEFNPDGFDWKHNFHGITNLHYDQFGFDFYGIHCETKQVYDKHYFGRDGFLYEKNKETGEYKKTGKRVNAQNFDQRGDYEEKEYRRLYNGEVLYTGRKIKYKTNPFGIDIDGIYHEDEVRDEGMLREIKIRKEAEAEKRRLEEEKREEEARQKREREEKEEKERVKRVKQEKLDKRHTLMNEFKKKFDENGICMTTNLPYDEFYFRADGTNVITGEELDIRGFNCIGKWRDNDVRDYDKNGFKQDGTHYKTGQKYYAGYNAFGIDRNGKPKHGYSIHSDITTAKEYLRAVFKPTETVNINTYITKYIQYHIAYPEKNPRRQAKEELRKKLYIAGEMYPPLKEELNAIIEETKKILDSKMAEYQRLKSESIQNEELIKKCSDDIETLKSRIGAVSLGMGER